MAKLQELTWDAIEARRMARNFLVKPARTSEMVEVVRAVGGIQAQVTIAAELDLAARVTGITQVDVRAALVETRTLVKTYGPRGTLHLLPADELPLWMAAMRGRARYDETPWYASLKVEPERAEALVNALGEALDGKCLLREQLADEAARRVGEWARDGIASAWAEAASLEAALRGMLCFGPPQGAKVTFVRADRWIPHWQNLDPEASLLEVLRRYLAAYGPATPQDFGHWFLLKPNKARLLFDALGDQVREVAVEGERAWQLASERTRTTQLPAANLYLLPQYDCYILGARFGRERVVPEAARERIATFGRGRFEGATGVPVLLVDGVVTGIWERDKRGKNLLVRVETFGALDTSHQHALEQATERLGKFFGMKALLDLGRL